MITLTKDERKILANILKTHATDQPYRVLVFGSRVSGQAQKYSDIDLALIGSHSVPMATLAALSEALENSPLPYMVDLVDFHRASAALKSQIKQSGLELVQL